MKRIGLVVAALFLMAGVVNAGPPANFYTVIGLDENSLLGTTDQILVTPNATGTVFTLSTPQNLDTAADFQVSTLLAGDGAVGIGAGAIQFAPDGYFGLYNSAGSYGFSRGGVGIFSANGTYLSGAGSPGLAVFKHSGAAGSASAPTFPFTGDTDTGAYRAEANKYAISAGGLSIMQLSNTTAAENSGLAIFNGPVRLYEGEWEDLPMAASTGQPGSGIPDFVLGGISNATGLYCFDKNTDEELYFTAKMQHGYREGSDTDLHIHWVPTTSGGGRVQWIAEYTWTNVGDALPTTAVFVNAPDIAAGVQYGHQHHNIASPITGTGKGIGSIWNIHIYRDANGTFGLDDYDADACLLEVDIHFRRNSFGSDMPTSKTNYR